MVVPRPKVPGLHGRAMPPARVHAGLAILGLLLCLSAFAQAAGPTYGIGPFVPPSIPTLPGASNGTAPPAGNATAADDPCSTDICADACEPLVLTCCADSVTCVPEPACEAFDLCCVSLPVAVPVLPVPVLPVPPLLPLPLPPPEVPGSIPEICGLPAPPCFPVSEGRPSYDEDAGRHLMIPTDQVFSCGPPCPSDVSIPGEPDRPAAGESAHTEGDIFVGDPATPEYPVRPDIGFGAGVNTCFQLPCDAQGLLGVEGTLSPDGLTLSGDPDLDLIDEDTVEDVFGLHFSDTRFSGECDMPCDRDGPIDESEFCSPCTGDADHAVVQCMPTDTCERAPFSIEERTCSDCPFLRKEPLCEDRDPSRCTEVVGGEVDPRIDNYESRIHSLAPGRPVIHAVIDSIPPVPPLEPALCHLVCKPSVDRDLGFLDTSNGADVVVDESVERGCPVCPATSGQHAETDARFGIGPDGIHRGLDAGTGIEHRAAPGPVPCTDTYTGCSSVDWESGVHVGPDGDWLDVEPAEAGLADDGLGTLPALDPVTVPFFGSGGLPIDIPYQSCEEATCETVEGMVSAAICKDMCASPGIAFPFDASAESLTVGVERQASPTTGCEPCSSWLNQTTGLEPSYPAGDGTTTVEVPLDGSAPAFDSMEGVLVDDCGDIVCDAAHLDIHETFSDDRINLATDEDDGVVDWTAGSPARIGTKEVAAAKQCLPCTPVGKLDRDANVKPLAVDATTKHELTTVPQSGGPNECVEAMECPPDPVVTLPPPLETPEGLPTSTPLPPQVQDQVDDVCDSGCFLLDGFDEAGSDHVQNNLPDFKVDGTAGTATCIPLPCGLGNNIGVGYYLTPRGQAVYVTPGGKLGAGIGIVPSAPPMVTPDDDITTNTGTCSSDPPPGCDHKYPGCCWETPGHRECNRTPPKDSCATTPCCTIASAVPCPALPGPPTVGCGDNCCDYDVPVQELPDRVNDCCINLEPPELIEIPPLHDIYLPSPSIPTPTLPPIPPPLPPLPPPVDRCIPNPPCSVTMRDKGTTTLGKAPSDGDRYGDAGDLKETLTCKVCDEDDVQELVVRDDTYVWPGRDVSSADLAPFWARGGDAKNTIRQCAPLPCDYGNDFVTEYDATASRSILDPGGPMPINTTATGPMPTHFEGGADRDLDWLGECADEGGCEPTVHRSVGLDDGRGRPGLDQRHELKVPCGHCPSFDQGSVGGDSHLGLTDPYPTTDHAVSESADIAACSKFVPCGALQPGGLDVSEKNGKLASEFVLGPGMNLTAGADGATIPQPTYGGDLLDGLAGCSIEPPCRADVGPAAWPRVPTAPSRIGHNVSASCVEVCGDFKASSSSDTTVSAVPVPSAGPSHGVVDSSGCDILPCELGKPGHADYSSTPTHASGMAGGYFGTVDVDPLAPTPVTTDGGSVEETHRCLDPTCVFVSPECVWECSVLSPCPCPPEWPACPTDCVFGVLVCGTPASTSSPAPPTAPISTPPTPTVGSLRVDKLLTVSPGAGALAGVLASPTTPAVPTKLPFAPGVPGLPAFVPVKSGVRL